MCLPHQPEPPFIEPGVSPSRSRFSTTTLPSACSSLSLSGTLASVSNVMNWNSCSYPLSEIVAESIDGQAGFNPHRAFTKNVAF